MAVLNKQSVLYRFVVGDDKWKVPYVNRGIGVRLVKRRLGGGYTV